MELVALGLIVGITGSLHCVGMCGPIALALPLDHSNNVKKSIGIVSYNLGRITTYSFIGMLFGFFGEGLQLAGILQMVSILLGVIILLSLVVPHILKKINFSNSLYLKLNSWVKQKMGIRLKKKSNMSLFVLGTLNGLLPCGLVFLAIASAISQGSVIEGALFMAFFGLGTLPVMFLLPFFSHTISMSIRTKLRRSVPFIMALFGVLFILRGLNLGIPYLSPKFNETRTEIKSCCH